MEGTLANAYIQDTGNDSHSSSITTSTLKQNIYKRQQQDFQSYKIPAGRESARASGSYYGDNRRNLDGTWKHGLDSRDFVSHSNDFVPDIENWRTMIVPPMIMMTIIFIVTR
jgi:hypothetical protein